MIKVLSLLVMGVLFLSGCSTMTPPRYSVSVDNIQELKKLENAKAMVSGLTMPGKFDSGCRMMGPIEPADKLTIPQFITKAFNDEFKMADVYSEGGAKISGNITKIKFSSMDGLTNGNWDISLALKSTNGATLEVQNKYEFRSGFDAITACNATADALAPAVQDLIKKTITDPGFKKLI
jgi:hypothetical protein